MRARRCTVAMLGAIAGRPWVDPARRPYVDGGTAWVPVRDGYDCDDELPERSSPAVRGYQRLGDLVLFHGSRPDRAAVEGAVVRCRPRGVLWVRGHAGVQRVPGVEVLWGAGGETVHRERGLSYRLDPSRVMFSGGNREEKARLAGLVRPGERAADLFAGIGYFTLTLARAGARVHAMEINPDAFGYLAANLALNGLSDRVQAERGDCRDLLAGTYDRLVLGHFDAPAFLDSALAHVRPGTVLHVHGLERTPGELGPVLGRTAAERGFEVRATSLTVKKYGPRRSHAVHDLVIL